MQKDLSNNYHAIDMVMPQRYIEEARAFLANAEDNQLVQIFAESFYMDDMGGVA